MSNLRQCPYDPLHQVSAKTFALHLVKCKRQHPEVKMATCHFDTSHLVKEEELKQHMKTCSSRKQLLEYKITYDNNSVSSVCKQEDPAENLIYNTDEPNKWNNTGGKTLLDDTECWDDFAHKAYDPLENCKSKLQGSKTFILPNPNKFAGQMKAAASLAERQAKNVQDGPPADQEVNEEGRRSEDEYDNARHVDRKSDKYVNTRQSDAKKVTSNYDDAACTSSSRQKDRHVQEQSSIRRYEAEVEKRHRIKQEGTSHRTNERLRSESTSSTSDRKSQQYYDGYTYRGTCETESDRKSVVSDGYDDGYTYRGTYDASRSHRDGRKNMYNTDKDRGRYDRYSEHDRTSNRSYGSNRPKYEPYQRSHRPYDTNRYTRNYNE